MTNKLLCGLLAVIAAVGAHRAVPVAAADGWVNATGSLMRKLSECGNLQLLSPVPGSDVLIAGIARRGLWLNKTGTTWLRMGDGAGSDRIENRPSSIVYDPTNPDIFWESGNYGGGGVYKTTDGGATFHRLGDISHNDFVSVDFSDPERRTLLASGHEQAQMVHLSNDGGQTWVNIGESLPGGGMTSYPMAINARTFLVEVAGGDKQGIYRSRDGGVSWRRTTTERPFTKPMRASTGVIYWGSNGYLLRSADYGASWVAVGAGLQIAPPIELPDKRLVALGATTLLISANSGATWTPLGPRLPYHANGVIYSPERKAFYIWRFDCGDEVLPDAVMRLDFDIAATAEKTP